MVARPFPSPQAVPVFAYLPLAEVVWPDVLTFPSPLIFQITLSDVVPEGHVPAQLKVRSGLSPVVIVGLAIMRPVVFELLVYADVNVLVLHSV